jgi:hypothetical protein
MQTAKTGDCKLHKIIDEAKITGVITIEDIFPINNGLS